MVNARLHIICGNCGCKDMFRHEIKYSADYGESGKGEHVVFISCGNCSTIHDLNDNLKNIDSE